MLFAILLATFYIAINVYGVIITKLQKSEVETLRECGKLMCNPEKGMIEDAPTSLESTHEKESERNISEEDENVNQSENSLSMSENLPKGQEKAQNFATENDEKSDKKEKKSKKKKDKKPLSPSSCLELSENRIKDSKIIVAALLGGALGIYVTMLVSKYRIKNLIMMVGLPVLIALNVYILVMAFNTWIIY